MRYTTRPLSDRTWLRPATQRKRSAFDSTWSTTLELLDREVRHLGGRDVVIEVDVREQDIRLDGMLRANARADSPAVVVAFETRQHGPMLYRCDRFERSYRAASVGWQENIRAIAKTLEALRSVDRYGATETGQQYAGFKALPAGTAMPASHMTRERAIAILASYVDVPPQHLNLEPESLRSTWRRARRLTHPDRHAGDQTKWDVVEQAAQVLGVTR